MKKVSYLPESVKFDLTSLTQQQVLLFNFILDNKNQKKAAAFKLDTLNQSLLSDLAQHISVSYIQRIEMTLEDGTTQVVDQHIVGDSLQYVQINPQIMLFNEFPIPFIKDGNTHFATPHWFNICKEKPTLFNILDADKSPNLYHKFLDEMLNDFSLTGDKFAEHTFITSTFS